MKFILLICLLSMAGFCSHAQQYTKEIIEKKHFDATKNLTVVVENIFGNVLVQASKNEDVTFEIKKLYKGYKQSQLDKAMEQVKIGWIERNDSIIAYIQAPFICNKWNGCDDQGRWIRHDEKYEFRFDITLKLPANASLTVGTIDQGRVNIEGIVGKISAQNVNGNVSVIGAKQLLVASTVNGDVLVEYADRPTFDAKFNSISGDIKVYCDESLNAAVFSKSMDGEFFTSYHYTTLAPKMIKTRDKQRGKTVFRMENKTGIQIGKESGPQLTMETLSGNMYLRSF
ncbi:MAG: hypothetical protein ACI81G_000562 [Gammaproteobacteria bacterium]|jgi:hypothetical protein